MTQTLSANIWLSPKQVREQLRQVLFSARFEAFLVVLLFLNAITLGALTYDHGQPDNSLLIAWLISIDKAIVAVFVVEMALKIYACRLEFFKSGWNIFDFAVIGISLFGMPYPLSVIRSLRILRTIRLATKFPSMKIVIESFLRAMPGIASVLSVLVIIVFIFAVVGTRLFGAVAPDLFGSLHLSTFTLFTVLTLEGWPDVASQVMEHVPMSWMFFVAFILINSFVVLNLVIAVIIDSMHKEYDQHAEEEREDILDEIKAMRVELKQVLEASKTKTTSRQ